MEQLRTSVPSVRLTEGMIEEAKKMAEMCREAMVIYDLLSTPKVTLEMPKNDGASKDVKKPTAADEGDSAGETVVEVSSQNAYSEKAFNAIVDKTMQELWDFERRAFGRGPLHEEANSLYNMDELAVRERDADKDAKPLYSRDVKKVPDLPEWRNKTRQSLKEKWQKETFDKIKRVPDDQYGLSDEHLKKMKEQYMK